MYCQQFNEGCVLQDRLTVNNRTSWHWACVVALTKWLFQNSISAVLGGRVVQFFCIYSWKLNILKPKTSSSCCHLHLTVITASVVPVAVPLWHFCHNTHRQCRNYYSDYCYYYNNNNNNNNIDFISHGDDDDDDDVHFRHELLLKVIPASHCNYTCTWRRWLYCT